LLAAAAEVAEAEALEPDEALWAWDEAEPVAEPAAAEAAAEVTELEVAAAAGVVADSVD
jgi:hypothetical protein